MASGRPNSELGGNVMKVLAHPATSGGSNVVLALLATLTLVGGGLGVVFMAGQASRDPEVRTLELEVRVERGSKEDARRERDAARDEADELRAESRANEQWATEERARADAEAKGRQDAEERAESAERLAMTTADERDQAIAQRDAERENARREAQRAALAEAGRSAATDHAMRVEQALADAEAGRSRTEAELRAARDLADHQSREIELRDAELRRVGGDRQALIGEAFEALVAGASAGECLRLVRFGAEVDCDARTRSLLEGQRDRFFRCWESDNAHPYYVAGLRGSSATLFPLREGSVRFCDPRLRDV